MKDIVFITGNENKLREAKQILGVNIISESLDLMELQAVDLEDVIKDKLRHGYDLLNKPVMVEDTGLFLNALNGFPGALIKMLLERAGREGIVNVLKGFRDNTVIAKCAIGFTGDGKALKVFIGDIKGRIVEPRGESGFGWDPIFQPEGFDKTFAEMSSEEKNAISHRFKALKKFKEFLENEGNV
ncbi:MAG: RdgB/HAM1 family non-canonical purine NTP pyrophosphatase [Nanoarchaeota archaeon]|nr:RdgB/HAM1 family non-canonical purine NTP pyrophosphatase [Nanoarchaeota archaeon]